MNAVFALIFIFSAIALLVQNPAAFLPALLEGGSKSASLCISLLASYAVWLGLMQVWEDSGVTRGISRAIKPLCRKLFKTDNEEALAAIGMNLSANLLGIGGAATPYGIKAANLLAAEKESRYASSMLFVVNATSLQLIPTSVVAFRVSLGSANPADIILPTMISTVFSTLLGVALVRIFIPLSAREKSGAKTPFFKKARGQG
jgi:spore maturation protein A